MSTIGFVSVRNDFEVIEVQNRIESILKIWGLHDIKPVDGVAC